MKHFSVSSVELFERCSLCWYFRYQKKEKETVINGGRMYFGRCMSIALETIHNQLVQNSLTAGRYAFINEYIKHQNLGLEPTPDMDHGLWLLDEYSRKGIFRGVPEFKFKVEIKQLPLPVLGYMDLLLEDERGTHGIVEFKTSMGRWDQSRVDNSLQGILYWCAYWSLFRSLPEEFTFVIFRTDDRRVDYFKAEYSKEQCLQTMDRLNGVFQEIQNGEFVGKCSVHKEKKASKIELPTFRL